MLGRHFPLGAVTALQIVLLAIVFSAAFKPNVYGFMLLGGVVGWMLYYFVRRYTLFNPKTLAATLSAIVGGAAVAWMATMRGLSSSIEPQYFTGLGIGFFAYAAYAGFCSWLFALGYIKSPMKFEIAIGCGPVDSKVFDDYEELMEFEERATKWMGGDISDEQLRAFIDGLEMDKKKLLKYISEDPSLSQDALVKLRQNGMLAVS